MKRLSALLGLLVGISCLAQADRSILAPSGRSVGTGAKAEILRTDTHGGTTMTFLQAGLPNGLELEVMRDDRPNNRKNAVSAQFTILPDTGYTPSAVVGVRDITNETRRGRGYYAASSYQLPMLPENPFVHDITVFAGLGIDGIDGLFGGLELNLIRNLRARVEYDSRDFNAMLQMSPLKGLYLGVGVIGDRLHYGASMTLRL